MPGYDLRFLPAARREWDKLDGSIQQRFIKVLKRRLEEPRVAGAALIGMPDCYKIKLRELGYRLVYHVDGRAIVVVVLAVGTRERGTIYDLARYRFDEKRSRD